MTEKFLELEKRMWNAAQARNSAEFLNVVDQNAVMICGGFKCSGADYARVVGEFDCAHYEISDFIIVAQSADFVQVQYVIETTAALPENSDLSGKFFVTSTWKCFDGKWRLVFNMDRQIFS